MRLVNGIYQSPTWLFSDGDVIGILIMDDLLLVSVMA